MSGCGKKHNILILDNQLGMGGVEKKLFDFISRIDHSHFAVKICCLKEGGYFRDAFMEMGIPFHEKILQYRYDVGAYRRFVQVLEEESVDAIYTFVHPNTTLFSAFARMTGRVRGLVISFHAMGNADGGRLLRRWQPPVMRKADRILAVADIHRDYLVASEGIERNQITVIHNGVDVEKYRPGPPREDLAAELGIGDGDLVVTTVASLKPLKRIDLLLRAASQTLPEFPSARFLIVGGGPDREILMSLAGELGIADRIIFAGIRDDIDDILRLSDLFVLPSATEAFPNVLLEAMASGLPVVSTDVGAVREQIEDGVNGTLIPPRDVHAIAVAIRELLGKPETMTQFGRRSREIVEEKFRLDGMCAKRERVLAEILCQDD